MSKLALLAVLIVVASMCQPIYSFGLLRLDVQKDPAVVNAINRAITSKLQSLTSILNSFLTLKNSYRTVNINTSHGSNSGSSNGSKVVQHTIPLYRKTINVNYGTAPISNTIEGSSDDAPSKSTNSVRLVGETFSTASKIIGGLANTAPAKATKVSTLVPSSKSDASSVA